MATRADFTEDEWKAMERGVLGAGMLVSISDPGFTDSFGEARAISRYLAEQHSSAANELIRELAGMSSRAGFGITDSPAEVEAGTLEALRSARETLAAKAPDAVDAYRDLVLGVAEHAATAKSGVEEAETAAIERIRAALG
jgi:hypothetical protein